MGKELFAFALGVAFWAGVSYARDIRTRRDLKGVSQKIDRHVDRTRQRFIHTIVVLMLMSEGKDMRTVLDLLKRDVE